MLAEVKCNKNIFYPKDGGFLTFEEIWLLNIFFWFLCVFDTSSSLLFDRQITSTDVVISGSWSARLQPASLFGCSLFNLSRTSLFLIWYFFLSPPEQRAADWKRSLAHSGFTLGL